MSDAVRSIRELLRDKAVFGWTMYDWANSAFATTIMAAVLPVYYHKVAAATLSEADAVAYWAYTAGVALVLVALLSPIMGAIADLRPRKKKFLTFFALMGMTGTALLYFVTTGDWLKASIFYIIGNVGFAAANVFYDALLPHISRNPKEMDMISSLGYAMGYLGGGILLAINLAMIMLAPEDMQGLMTRLAFLSVALWWLVFTIPLWKWVPEPRTVVKAQGGNPVVMGFKQLWHTFMHLRQFREALKFLLAFWLYTDGIGTIIKMATIYGSSIGIGQTHLIGTLLLVQFVGIPFAVLFGRLANRIGVKRGIYLALFGYVLISIGGYFMSKPWHFWALGLAVAMVQGGSQALSRSLFGRLIPQSLTAEFYSFFSVSAKFAGIAGPFIFGYMTQVFQNSRLSILAVVFFFISGILLLIPVNVEKGMTEAQSYDAKLREGGATA